MLTRLKAWWMAFRFRHIVLELLVSLCLAFLVWLYTHSRARTSIDHAQIPVQIQLAASQREQYALEVQGQARLSVSFTGPGSRLRELRRKLQRGQVQVTATLHIPEEKQNEATMTQVVRVNSSEVPVPPGVTAELAEEGLGIPVTLHRLTERTLPVRLDYAGDARVSQVLIEPATVRVRGPKALLERAAFIHTQPYSLPVSQEQNPSGESSLRDQVALVNELEGRPVQADPGTVQFRCQVVPKHKIYELKEVPVNFLCPVNFPWQPRFAGDKQSKVALRLIGPASEETPNVLAFVDLTSGSYARGRNLEPLRLQLPKDFQLVHTTPLINFFLEEPDRPAAGRERAQKTDPGLSPRGGAGIIANP
jgi:hypothetical protein